MVAVEIFRGHVLASFVLLLLCNDRWIKEKLEHDDDGMELQNVGGTRAGRDLYVEHVLRV